MFIVPIQEYERSYSGGLDVPVRSVFQMHFLTTRLAAIATSQDPLPGRFRLHRPVPSHGVFQISTRHGYASIIGSSWENKGHCNRWILWIMVIIDHWDDHSRKRSIMRSLESWDPPRRPHLAGSLGLCPAQRCRWYCPNLASMPMAVLSVKFQWIFLQCGASKIAKLVITTITSFYGNN